MCPARYSYPSARSASLRMCGAPVMSRSASATASANDWVSTGTPSMAASQSRTGSRNASTTCGSGARLLRPPVRGELQARHVVQRHHHLVGADVAGMRDPPPAILAAGVTVLVERGALDHDVELGGDHGVLEGPGPGRRGARYVDLGLAGEVHRDDAGAEALAQERDDLLAPAQLDRLAEGPGAVVNRGVGGEHLADLVPQLQVHAAQVPVLEPADLFECGKVHAPRLPFSIDFPQEPVLLFRCCRRLVRRSRALLLRRVDDRPVVLRSAGARR